MAELWGPQPVDPRGPGRFDWVFVILYYFLSACALIVGLILAVWVMVWLVAILPDLLDWLMKFSSYVLPWPGK